MPHCYKCGREFDRNFWGDTAINKDKVTDAIELTEKAAIVSQHGVRAARVGRAGCMAGKYGASAEGVQTAMTKAATRGWETSGNVTRGAGMAKAGSFTSKAASKAAIAVPIAIGTYQCVRAIKNGSGREATKAVAGNAAALGGGMAGGYGGAALGTMIFPGVGTVIGGLIGAVASSVVAQNTTNVVVDVVADECDADDICPDCNALFTK